MHFAFLCLLGTSISARTSSLMSLFSGITTSKTSLSSGISTSKMTSLYLLYIMISKETVNIQIRKQRIPNATASTWHFCAFSQIPQLLETRDRASGHEASLCEKKLATCVLFPTLDTNVNLSEHHVVLGVYLIICSLRHFGASRVCDSKLTSAFVDSYFSSNRGRDGWMASLTR